MNSRRSQSLETRAKIAAALRGRAKSAEHKERLSDAAKGRPSPRKGVALDDETRAKISASLTGRTLDDKHRKKLATAQTRRWAEKPQTFPQSSERKGTASYDDWYQRWREAALPGLLDANRRLRERVVKQIDSARAERGLLHLDEVAERLGVHPTRVRQHVRCGRLKPSSVETDAGPYELFAAADVTDFERLWARGTALRPPDARRMIWLDADATIAQWKKRKWLKRYADRQFPDRQSEAKLRDAERVIRGRVNDRRTILRYRKGAKPQGRDERWAAQFEDVRRSMQADMAQRGEPSAVFSDYAVAQQLASADCRTHPDDWKTNRDWNRVDKVWEIRDPKSAADRILTALKRRHAAAS